MKKYCNIVLLAICAGLSLNVQSGELSLAESQVIVQNVLKDKAVVEEVFPGLGPLSGAVLVPAGMSEAKAIVWLMKGENAIIVGQIFTEKQQELSLLAHQQYILPKQRLKTNKATDPQSRYLGAGGIALFQEPASVKVLYVFADPNCHYCHSFYKAMMDNEAIFRHKRIAVKWIPVSIMGGDSLMKAQAILQGGLRHWPRTSHLS
nr:hypothetical protein [Methylomarinum sp. Ch1-1]MDP4523168.1 hypothetical protein [Methylomarinum sp. Ch1-1]